MRYVTIFICTICAIAIMGTSGGCGKPQVPTLDSEQVKAKVIQIYRKNNGFDFPELQKTVKVTLQDIRPFSIQKEIRKAVAEASLWVQIGNSTSKYNIKYSAQYNTDGILCVDVLNTEAIEIEDNIPYLRSIASNDEEARLKLQKHDMLDFSEPGPPVSTETNKTTNKTYGIPSIDKLIKENRKWIYAGYPFDKFVGAIEYHQRAAYYGNKTSRAFLAATLNSRGDNDTLFTDAFYKITEEGCSIGIKEDLKLINTLAAGKITPFVRKRMGTPALSDTPRNDMEYKEVQKLRNIYFHNIVEGHKAYVKDKGSHK